MDLNEEKENMTSFHERQISKTMTYEPSMPSVWDLMVNDGFIPSQTIRSLHELEDYTIATKDQQQITNPGIPRQRSSHL